jgi:hypothetical protein
MSFIPKYVLKRVFPVDSVKLIDDNLEVTFINILSPVQIKTLPPNCADYMEIKVDGNPLDKSILEQMVFRFDEKEILLSDPSAANNLLVPEGTIIKITIPNPGVQQGETHKIDIKIADYQKFRFSIERVIQ